MKPFNKSIFVLVILSCLFSSKLLSQNTGYMGKKLLVNFRYSTNLFHVDNINAKGEVGIPFFPEFSIGYCLSKRGVLSITHDRFQTASDKDLVIEQQTIRDFTIVDVRSFGISYELHRKTTLAPLGMYFNFDGKLILTKAEEAALIDGNYNYLYFGTGIGYRTIFWNTFVLGFSGRVGLAFPVSGLNEVDYDYFTNTDNNPSKIYGYRLGTSIGFIF